MARRLLLLMFLTTSVQADLGNPLDLPEGASLLDRLVAAYDQSIEISRGPDRAPLSGVGTATARRVLQGNLVLLDSKVSIDGSAYDSWTLLGHDAEDDLYTLVVVDNASSRSINAEGRYDPASRTLAFSGTRAGEAREGEPTVFHFRFRFLPGGRLRITYDFDYPGRSGVRVYAADLLPRE